MEISLTKEILELNGFKYGDSHSVMNEAGFRLKKKRAGGFWLEVNDRVFIVIYVRQLQQALRLCGLTELANNFKIE